MGPFETILILILLWREIGVASLAGMAALFAMIPIQSVFGKLFSKYRRKTVFWRDERIRLTRLFNLQIDEFTNFQ